MISFLFIFCFCFLPNLIYSNVQFVLNPDCDIPSCREYSNGALYYGNHILGDKKIHLIYSSHYELTIIILQTSKDASPIFNYTAIAERNFTGAFRFEETGATNSFTMIIRRLIEFNDPDDTGKMNDNQASLNTYVLSNYSMSPLTSKDNVTEQPSFQYLFHQVKFYINL